MAAKQLLPNLLGVKRGLLTQGLPPFSFIVVRVHLRAVSKETYLYCRKRPIGTGLTVVVVHIHLRVVLRLPDLLKPCH